MLAIAKTSAPQSPLAITKQIVENLRKTPTKTAHQIGTPFCVTYDFDSETDGCVTVRFRDSMEQERVAIADLDAYFADKFTF